MPNIVETGIAANSFKTLIAAVKAAGCRQTPGIIVKRFLKVDFQKKVGKYE